MADEVAGRAIFEKVSADVGGNIAFAMIGLGVIWLIAKYWVGLAKFLFWIAAAVSLLGLAHFLLVTAAGAIGSIPKTSPTRNKWLWASSGFRLVEQIVTLSALWWAAKAVGYLR